MDSQIRKRVIVVLGMHRSGTSTVMKAIESLGVSIGDSLMPEAEGNNSKGFFEDLDIYELNEQMLSTLNTTWYDLSIISKEDVDYLNSKGFLEKALELIREKLKKCEIFGFKEPRTTKLALFWKNVFAQLNCRVDYVLALRHPHAVSMSLKKRDGIDIFRGQFLWLSYQLSALSILHNEDWIVQSYDSLISTPENQLKRLSQSLSLELDAVEAKSYSENFIDPTLRNFTVGETKDKFDNEFSLPLIKDVFNTLIELKDNDLSSTKLDASKSIDNWLNEFTRSKNQTNYITHLLGQLNYLQLQIVEKESQLSKLSEVNKNLPTEEASVIELSTYYGVLDTNEIIYSEAFSSKCFVTFSDGIQTLKFKPSQNHDGHIGSIRFDTANVSCLAYLFEFSIRSNTNDEELWSWSAESRELPWDLLSGGELIDFLPFNELMAAVVICTNDDPQMIFDIANLVPEYPKLLEIYLEVKVKLLPIKQGAEAAFGALTKMNNALIHCLESERDKNCEALENNISIVIANKTDKSTVELKKVLDLSTVELKNLMHGTQEQVGNFRSEITDIINKKMERQENEFKNKIQALTEKLDAQSLMLSNKMAELEGAKRQREETAIALENTKHQLEEVALALENAKIQLDETTLILKHRTHQIELVKKSRVMKTALIFSKIKNLD